MRRQDRDGATAPGRGAATAPDRGGTTAPRRGGAVAAVVLALLVALAGCSAPTAPTTAAPDATATTESGATTVADEPTATPTDADDSNDSGPTVAVRNGSLPVDAGRVFAGVRRVLGANASPPEAVRVVGDPADLAASGGVGSGSSRRFWRLVGVEPERALSEGVAVVATDAYLRRTGSDRTNSAVYRDLAAALPAGSPASYANDAYLAGSDYVDSRIDDPARLPTVFERPPRTSEGVIHGVPPGAEPPAALPVSVNATAPWRHVGTDRLGEAFVRTALENGASRERATAGAAGWGNDGLRVFRSTAGGDPGYAWVLRWDDAANASEFEAGLGDLLGSLGNRTDGGESAGRSGNLAGTTWRLPNATATVESPDDRTVVVVLGDSSFVDRVDVAGDEGRVVVRVAASG